MPGQMSLFGGRKQRGRKTPPAKEITLHIQIAQTLDRWGTKGWRYTHIGHGGFKLNMITAVRLKRMGVKRGWADFILLAPRRVPGPGGVLMLVPGVHFLEVKRQGEDLTDEQASFKEFCALNGYAFAKVDNLKDALAVLAGWGAIRINVKEA